MMSSSRAFQLLLAPLGAMLFSGSLAWGQTESTPSHLDAKQVEHSAPTDRSSAYYNFSMGHMYADMAQAYNRADYVNKAIDYYKQALKLDPSVSFINEELTDLYIQSGQLNKAVTEAEDLLKQNPNDIGARRILGRVYTRMIGDPQQGKIDEKMLRLSIEQYSKIVQQDPADTESQLLLARLYRVAKDPASEEKTYQAILAQDADNDAALAGLAEIYSERGDTKNAIDMLKRAATQNSSPRTLVMLATLYEQNKDYGAAADAWEQAMQLAPDNDQWNRALAQDLLFSDRVEEARKLYESLAVANPHDVQLQLRLSDIYLQKHDFLKAQSAINLAKQDDPDNIEVRYNEVMLLDAEGKTDDAIKSMKSIVDSTAKPEYTTQERSQRNRLDERLGMLYRSAGKYQLAVSTFRDISGDDDEMAPRAAVQVVETYRQAKDLSAARKEADAALKKFPKDQLVQREHASVLADSGKVDEAVSELAAQKDGKNDREVLIVTAQLYERAKRYTDEQKTLDEAEKLSTTKAEIVDVRFMRGALLEKMKNYEGAEGEFRKILKDDPSNAGALNYLGYMLADRNQQLDEAQQLITKALEIDPQNYAYMDSLGWVYYHQNHLDEAADQLRRALNKVNSDPTVHDHLGDVLLKQGKVKEAVAQWQASLKSWNSNPATGDVDPAEMAKVQRKLDDARVRIAQETHGQETHGRESH